MYLRFWRRRRAETTGIQLVFLSVLDPDLLGTTVHQRFHRPRFCGAKLRVRPAILRRQKTNIHSLMNTHTITPPY